MCCVSVVRFFSSLSVWGQERSPGGVRLQPGSLSGALWRVTVQGTVAGGSVSGLQLGVSGEAGES